jgi:hypothetical protein
MKISRRIVIISDLHCGHAVGLTHPDFDGDRRDSLYHKLYLARREYWKFYLDTIKSLRPIDILIVNGDCIEGKGEKSGGIELIENDRQEQCKMAVAAIKKCGRPDIYMVSGTPYHTGVTEELERGIANDVKAVKFGRHDWLNVNGLVFDYRHFTSGSQVPYGRHTAGAKDRVWNVLWNEDGAYPKADILIRSHVHYFTFEGGANWMFVTTPALQGKGTKFGAERMSGTVDFGLIHFDVTDKSDWSWSRHILKFKPQKPLLA